MPGVYSKPPARQEFAKDIECLLNGIKWQQDTDLIIKNLNIVIPIIISTFEKERVKARDEARNNDDTTADESSYGKMENFDDRVTRKERDVFQVFFDCGVHEAFCQSLKYASYPSALPFIMQIFEFYMAVFIIEFDPFDDDIGLISLLNYFLCERHSYYVDVQWQEHELKNMTFFLKGILSMMKPLESIEHTESQRVAWVKTQLAALRLFFNVLWSFPPHRVVTNMALVFNSFCCKTLLEHFRLQASVQPEFKGEFKSIQVQVIAAISSFGVGLSLSKAAIPASLYHSSMCTILEERCPCDHCEFKRRVIKMVRHRDELGIQGASQAKKDICSALLRGGALNFIGEYMQDIEWNLPRHIRDKEANSPLECCGKNAQLEYVAIALNLLAWHCEDTASPEAILLNDNKQILRGLIKVFQSIAQEKDYCSIIFTSMDVSQLFSVFLNLILRSILVTKKISFPEVMPLITDVLRSLCKYTVEHDPTVNPVALSATEFVIDSSILKIGYLLFPILEIIFVASQSSDNTVMKSDDDGNSMFKEYVLIALEACESLFNIYDYIYPTLETNDSKEVHLQFYNGPLCANSTLSFDRETFNLCLLGSMATLVGAIGLNKLPQRRWRFITNPAAYANISKISTMFTTVRKIMDDIKRANRGCCVGLRTLASIIIYRSEQAAAVELHSV